MTAHMPRQQAKEAIVETTLLRDFMQTVQYNYTLNSKFMNTIDVHQKDQFGNTALYWAFIITICTMQRFYFTMGAHWMSPTISKKHLFVRPTQIILTLFSTWWIKA